MQVTIAATSSRLDEDTILIEVATTIGESTTTTRAGYSAFELAESRYLAGTLEERIEKLRLAAQGAAEASFNAQYAVFLARAEAFKGPAVEPTPAVPEEVVEEAPVVPVKATRAKRTKPAAVETKPESEQE